MQYHSKEKLAEDDLSLVLAAQQGDRTAFEELVKRHQPACLKLAISVLHERESAEDEVQNAFFKAWEHLGRFQRDSRFLTWLSRIVLNQCLMRLRQTRRARFLYIDEGLHDEDVAVIDLPGHELSPEARLGRREVAEVFHHEVQRIPPLLRNAFVLRDVQQLPMPEVAERLGISIAAAKSRLLRARAELKQRLEKHCGRMGAATLLAES